MYTGKQIEIIEMDGEGSNTSWNTKSSLLSDLSLDLEELELQPLIANNNTSLDLTETLDFDIGDILELSAAEIPTEQKTWYNDQSNYCPDAKQEINFFVDSTQHSTHNRLQHMSQYEPINLIFRTVVGGASVRCHALFALQEQQVGGPSRCRRSTALHGMSLWTTMVTTR